MSAQPTRAERKAARALEIAAQQANKTEFQIELEKKEQRRRNRKLLTTLIMIMFATPALAVTIMTVRDTMQQQSDEIVSLVKTTYSVQDAGPTKNMMYIGKDITISIDGKSLTCRGISKEEIVAKKPLECDDNTVIEAIRPN